MPFCPIADCIMSTLQLSFGNLAEKKRRLLDFSFLVGFIFKKLKMKLPQRKAKDFLFLEKNENKVVCVIDIPPKRPKI